MALLLYQPLYPTNGHTFDGIKPLEGTSYADALKKIIGLQTKVVLYEQDDLVERTLKTFSDAGIFLKPAVIKLNNMGLPVGAIDGRFSSDEATWFDSLYVSRSSTVKRISCTGGYLLASRVEANGARDVTGAVGGLADIMRRLEKLEVICVPVYEAIYSL